MSSITRRFGTDVSNIPSDLFRKAPSKKNVNKTQLQSTKLTTPIATPSSKESKSSPLFDVMESLMDTLKISVDDEITVNSPIKLAAPIDDFRYERDFLMRFRQFCTAPIDGLIAEVVPGYHRPEPSCTGAAVSTASSSSSSRTITKTPVDASDVTVRPDNTMPIVEPSSVAPMEWRVKKIKKQKPREQDSRRLAARQKQIDIGMNTVGYQRFLESVPAHLRTKSHPKIPDIAQVCSKRSWDGQVRKWRRQLHDFDPTPEAGQDSLAQTAADRHATDGPSEDEDSSECDDSEGEN